MALTEEQIAEIWRRRKERALRWRRESGEFAPGLSLEEGTEETLSATPSPELDSEKRRRARERESQ
jgi:hypothetical protein